MVPTPPYYAVIFTSTRTDVEDGYAEMDAVLERLAKDAPGFLGLEAARKEDGFGVTVSYWESENAIAAWKANVDHLAAQARGRTDWYSAYKVRIAKVEREYEFSKGKDEV